MLQAAHLYHDRLFRPSSQDPMFMAALLRLRGFAVQDVDAVEVLDGSSRRLMPASQESQLLFGLVDVLQMMRDRASQGRPPDGWFLVELFKTMTRGLPRFRNNALRVDQPWDGILYVAHPRPTELTAVLDRFDYGHRYRDQPAMFDRLHPLRQGFRVMWRFARIAPFPDLNVPMAWLAMCSWLLARGYPMLMPEAADREAMPRFASAPAPTRVVQWEARLLKAIAG
ncbi:MAG: hypothetical protein AB7O97_03645 [Planctomycetota bacterium]